LRTGVQLEDGPAKFDEITRAGGEGLNNWFNVTLKEGRNREVRRLWETQEVQVSRLIRVRYGDIKLEKSIPRGGWMELPLDKVNYLRELVGLPPETRSKVLVDDKRSQFKQNAQIRRAVRKHREMQHTENRQAHPERNYGGASEPLSASPAAKNRKPTRSQAPRSRLGTSDAPRGAERRPAARKPRG
ncbi:MAG: ribosomal large subunit pseudouridine synthase B, partial [Aeromonadaceae bacterium]